MAKRARKGEPPQAEHRIPHRRIKPQQTSIRKIEEPPKGLGGSLLSHPQKKINFATSQNCRIFAVDFRSEITEALYFVLAVGKREKLPLRIMQDECNGSRIIAWTVCYLYIIQGNSHDLPTGEVVYGTTLHLMLFCSTLEPKGALKLKRQQNKTATK